MRNREGDYSLPYNLLNNKISEVLAPNAPGIYEIYKISAGCYVYCDNSWRYASNNEKVSSKLDVSNALKAGKVYFVRCSWNGGNSASLLAQIYDPLRDIEFAGKTHVKVRSNSQLGGSGFDFFHYDSLCDKLFSVLDGLELQLFLNGRK